MLFRAPILFEDQSGDEKRIGEIRESVIELLRGVEFA